MRERTEANRTFTICVNSYDQGVMTGQFYCLGQKEDAETFNSLLQLLLGLEQYLDDTNYPQSFTAMRFFYPIQEVTPDGRVKVRSREGRLGTFIVKVMSRQHTSWQGMVTWLEGRGEQTFRSALELILLMDSALKKAEQDKTN